MQLTDAGLISGVAAFGAIVLYALIALRIRRGHPNVWNRLGNPELLYDPTAYGSRELGRFIWRLAWLRLPDTFLWGLCILFLLAVGLTVTAFVLGMLRSL